MSLNASSKTTTPIKKLVFVAIFGALSFLLFMFNFALPIFPSFVKMDIADLPALFSGFFMGPLAGLEVILVRLALKIVIQGSDTAFVGELSNLAGSAVFVILAALIYMKIRTRKGAVISLVVSSIVVSIVYVFLNAYVMFPLYSRLYGLPLDTIIGMGTAINPRITNLTTMMLFSILPFNLLKHAVVSLLTFLIYKRVGNILKSLLYNS